MRVSRSITFPAVAAGLLALTSCTAVGPESDGATGSPDTTATGSPTQEPTDAATAAAGGQAGAECLQGEWEGDLAAAQTSALGTLQLGELEVEPQVESSGESWVTFEDETMTTEYEDQTTTVTVSPTDNDQELVATMTLNGTATGSYTVEDDTLTITELDVSGLTTENTVQLGGEDYDLPGFDETQMDSLPVGSSFTFDCSEDELRLTPVVEDMPTDAVEGDVDESDVEAATEQVLTRR